MDYYIYEDKQVLSLFVGEEKKILDVGCGQGRYLIPLSEKNSVIGVDISQSQLNDLSTRGFNVIHLDDIKVLNADFDFILMSHIIEHITPDNIIDFLDRYINFLKPDGKLIIATPLLYDEFYDDYDHIKPYTPKALQILFSDYSQQAYKPDNRLTLKSLWIRKWPYIFRVWPNDNNWHRIIKRIMNRGLLYIYRMSGGSIGRVTGWVGEFIKDSN